jgi:oxygen-independent coproporphyrinogen-3 oxidase
MDSFQHRPPTGEISLYIHVPFCVRICPYCTFYHEPYRLADEQAYVEAVTREIRSALYSRTGRAALRTVYFGGGSPSRLAPESLRRLVESYTPCLVGKPDEIEQTIELNPEDVTADLLACLGEIGINRASLGIQSLESESQMWLGRCGPELNLRAIELVREGFANINLDLLVGIPGRTPGRLVGSLDQVMFFAPEHLSVYCLEAAGD